MFGSHLSIAGGLYKAIEAAEPLGMGTVQIFTKNQQQWRARPLERESIKFSRNRQPRQLPHQPCLAGCCSPQEEH
jgi:deoxyribonuclease-4